MGTIVSLSDGARHILSVRDLIGRSRHCDLRIEQRSASAEHVVMSWAAGRWMLRDLGSRNGTSVGGRRVEPGVNVALRLGAELSFGDDDKRWRLDDDAAPSAMARATDGPEVLFEEEGLLPLPTPNAPEVTVYLDASGAWRVELRGGAEPVADRAVVSAGGRTWVLRVPDALGSTVNSEPVVAPPPIEMRFKVSSDQEHVELAVRIGGRELDLGARAHHHVLLLLARARMSDAQAADIAKTSQGWVYQDDLARMLAIDEGRLNVDIYRARKQLAKVGVQGAAGIVERRADTRQLRIGTDLLEELRL